MTRHDTPLVGRDLSSLILGQTGPASITEPVYFMTDDDPTRGLQMNRRLGMGYYPIVKPHNVETVIARLDDGKLWKYTRYFDSPQYWSSPGTPGVDDPDTPWVDVKDVLRVQMQPDPEPEVYRQPEVVPCELTATATPMPDEFEMYNLTDDPSELRNRYGEADYLSQQTMLAQLLQEQCAQKRLRPSCGDVPGQPACA